MIYSLHNVSPQTDDAIFIAENATIIAQVNLGAETSVWFSAVLRGDIDTITIGPGTNIQDGSVVHVDSGHPVLVGSGVTVGHGAILHGCTIGDNVLIGMGATVLNGAVIGDNSIVGAGTLVPPGKRFEPRSLLIGTPARVIRQVSDDEIAETRANAKRYVENARRYVRELSRE